MSYAVILYDVDGVSQAQRREAEQRFRSALEDVLGGENLAAPVYAAYLAIIGTHGEAPGPDSLSGAQRVVFDQWQAAETAAVAAAFDAHRYMGDAMYEIKL